MVGEGSGEWRMGVGRWRRGDGRHGGSDSAWQDGCDAANGDGNDFGSTGLNCGQMHGGLHTLALLASRQCKPCKPSKYDFQICTKDLNYRCFMHTLIGYQSYFLQCTSYSHPRLFTSDYCTF